MTQTTQFQVRRYVATIINSIFFFGLLLYASIVFAESRGMTGVTKKNGVGCTCHDPSPSPGVIVTINGPTVLSPNQTANYTVTVQGGPAVRAGTDIASSAGILNVTSTVLQKVGDELTHSTPQPFTDGVATFTFSYTAPSTPGAYTIFANANSVNFNGDNTGDQWNFAPNKTITVTAATAVENASSVPHEFSLSQNYPNPFNPSTSISFDVARTGHLTLTVYDISGRVVSTLVDGTREPGSYKTSFNATGLASGVYFYTLRADGAAIQTKKLTLLK